MVCIPAYKDKKRGTWYASFYFTDRQGHRKKKIKRGFARQKDAKAYEDEFLKQGARTCDMSFASLVELYLPDMEHRLKPTTMQTKRSIIEGKALPVFKDLPVKQITPAHVRRWQSKLLAAGLAPTYVKTINNQLATIFNYATRYYGLAVSPARLAGSVGKKQAQEMHFWTVDEFKTFMPHVPKLPARTGLSILFWTDLRISELLSLRADDRLFPYTKSYFHRQMQIVCDAAGMEKIRLHDLRHSHAALLIRLGTPVLLVSQRLGHENIETTLKTYGHLYPTAGGEAVQKLDDLMR